MRGATWVHEASSPLNGRTGQQREVPGRILEEPERGPDQEAVRVDQAEDAVVCEGPGKTRCAAQRTANKKVMEKVRQWPGESDRDQMTPATPILDPLSSRNFGGLALLLCVDTSDSESVRIFRYQIPMKSTRVTVFCTAPATEIYRGVVNKFVQVCSC